MKLPPHRIACKFCGEIITLNPDGEQAREDGTDPHQQMRKHLLTHPVQVFKAAKEFGWLIDMLCFRSLKEDPHEWAQRILELVDYYSHRELV